MGRRPSSRPEVEPPSESDENMIWNSGVSDRKALLRDVLSWLWQVLVVLMISLSLIWLGTRLPSEQPSLGAPELVQHYVCISGVDGLIQQCRLSVVVPPTNSIDF